MSASQTSDLLYWVALGVYVVATGLHFAGFRRPVLAKVAVPLTFAGWVAHSGMIAFRAFAAGRVPWGNMYEYSTVLVYLMVTFYLFVLRRRSSLAAAAPFLMTLAVVSMAFARKLYTPIIPLQPALNSPWLKIHVISAITASSVFSIAFVFSVLYLLKERAERRAMPPGGGISADGGAVKVPAFSGSTVGAAYAGDSGGWPADHVEDSADEGAADGVITKRGILGRLPASQTLDTWAYRTTAVAFPIWTWAVIAGAIWASKAWGRYWGWDPKETWAFITWVVYAAYLHARATSGWRGRKAAMVNMGGFVALWICYYVVNLWLVGLHGYKNG